MYSSGNISEYHSTFIGVTYNQYDDQRIADLICTVQEKTSNMDWNLNLGLPDPGPGSNFSLEFKF